jgi:hypothetical protein
MPSHTTDRAAWLIRGAEAAAQSAYRGDTDADARARLAFEVGMLRSDIRTLCAEVADIPALIRAARLTPEQLIEILRAVHEVCSRHDDERLREFTEADYAADVLHDMTADQREPEQIADDEIELRIEIDADDARRAA